MFQKYVQINKRDLEKAIDQGINPMVTMFDEEHGDLPFFGNVMTGAGFGNSHHSSFSMAHIPGRWLNALLNAEDVLGKPADETAIQKLRKWTYASLESIDIGFPACIDPKNLDVIRETDLHNLREVMHALVALAAYRDDKHAHGLALGMIKEVERYFDAQTGCFKEAEYCMERNAKVQWWGGAHEGSKPFPVTFGRYIGPLVKFYQACGEPAALAQAIALKDCCFKHVLNARGDYDIDLFGTHTHSTTAMISSLAQLGAATQDHSILRRVDAFMNNGMKCIAIDTGWCIEGDRRRDDVGEINNTADIMETCLILGHAGYEGYYARAERILRAHFLPAQLLDTSFIAEPDQSRSSATKGLPSGAIGAFGFPCPYGHEYQEGSPISFNWDIVGGGVGGLCEAKRALYTKIGDMYSINLLFDICADAFTFHQPYDANGVGKIEILADHTLLRLRVPTHCLGIECSEYTMIRNGEWVYFPMLHKGNNVTLIFDFVQVQSHENFRGRTYTYRWLGEEVIGMENRGKRLCFFPSIDDVESK